MALAQSQKTYHALDHIGAWIDETRTLGETTETMTANEVIILEPHPNLEKVWSMDPATILAEYITETNLAGMETHRDFEKTPGSMQGTTLLGTLLSSEGTTCAHEEGRIP